MNTNSSKASQALEDFLKEITTYGFYISVLKTDPGSEFYKSFASLCEDLGIELKHLPAGDKLASSPIEAFNRTLRLAIEKVRATIASGAPVVSQMEKALSDIVSSYNHAKHSMTGFSPIEILQSKEIQKEVLVRVALRKARQLERLKPLSQGTDVRVLIRKGAFDKLSPNWSKETYTIEDYDKGKNRYKLEGVKKRYRVSDLQVVSMDDLMKKPIVRYGEGQVREKTKRLNKDDREVVNAPILEGRRTRKTLERLDL